MEKKFLMIASLGVVVAGLIGCSNREEVLASKLEGKKVVVYATTKASTNISPRTTLGDDWSVLWAVGDKIKIGEKEFTLDESTAGSTTGVFTGTALEDDTYTVYYPASYDGISWPNQQYVGANDISGAPMIAENVIVSNGVIPTINFTNVGGILHYTVKGSKSIKSINVKGTDTQGAQNLDVTLDCGTGVALAEEGTVFNIALPAGTYSNDTLTFTAIDESVATKTASQLIVKKNYVSVGTLELDFQMLLDTVLFDFGNSKNIITYTSEGTEDTGGNVEISKSDITITGTKAWATKGKKLEVYKSSTLTITAPGNITKIIFSYNGQCCPFDEAVGTDPRDDKGKFSSTGQHIVEYTPETPSASIKFSNNSSGKTHLTSLEVIY